MNICVLDIYKKVDYRISKDQNGQFGTSNDYGDNLFSKFLKRFVKKKINIPPLYVAQVIGELKKNKHNVEYHNKFFINPSIDLYIVVSSIVCHETEISVIKNLSKQGKKIFVIGPFASTLPDLYINAGAKVILGEPEFFFFNYTGDKNFNDYKDLISSSERDINDLSLPGWDIIFKNMVPSFSFLGTGPAITINASRGCPYSCFNYCVYPLAQGRKLRLKSPDKLLDEMIYFERTLKVKNFLFRDPVFSINKKHTIDICNRIINSKKKFNICVETHLKNIDDELIILFKKTGINLIYVGIESANEEVLSDAKRSSDSNLNQINKIKLLEKNGIKVKAMYILGLPSDTEDIFLKTLEYAKEICSSYAQFSVFTPYPGTPIFEKYKNKINTSLYEDFNQWQLVFDHPNFTKEQVRKLLGYAYKSYYTNPRWLVKNFLNFFVV